MNRLAPALALFALTSLVPAQVAYYNFAGNLRSTDSDPNSVASDLVPSNPIVFYTNNGYTNLCLGSAWQGGGTLEFDVTAVAGYQLDPTALVIQSSDLQPSTTVLVAISAYVNDVFIGRSTIIANPNTNKNFNLTGFGAIQGQGALHVRLEIEGRNDSDMYEFAYIKLRANSSPGTSINPNITPIGNCASNCFTVDGQHLTAVDRVEIDGVEASAAGWNYTIDSSTQMTVCPPAARAVGNYQLEVFANGHSGGTATLSIEQSDPVLGVVRNPALAVVTSDCFEIEGCGLTGIDRVRFGVDDLSQGGLIGDGRWHLISDSLIEVCPPQCLPAGSYRICLYNGANQVGCRVVTLFDPTQPTISCDADFPVGQLQCVYIHDGGVQQPNLVFGVVSSDPTPSVIPGLIHLGLGNNFTNYFCGVGIPGPCVAYCIGNIPAILAGRTLYFQGAILVPGGSVLPIPVTNVCATTYY